MKNNINVIKNFSVLPYLYGISFTPMKTFQSLAEKFGDFVRLKFWNESVYFVNDPEVIQYILKTNYNNFPRSSSIKDLEPLLGKGLFFSEDELWQSQRKLLTPAFHNSSLENFYTILTQEIKATTDKLDECLEKNNSIDLEHEFKELLLNLTFKNLVSPNVKLETEKLLHSLTQILKHTHNKWHNLRLLLSLFRKKQLRIFDFNKNKIALENIQQTVDQILNDTLEGKLEPASLLQILLSGHKDNSISLQQIKDEIQTILFAGYDTVAEVLLWLLYFVSKDNSANEKIMSELSNTNPNNSLTKLSMNDTPFLTACIKETLRLMPPAWSFYRTVKQDDKFENFTFPKGALIMISPYILHRNKKYWKNAEEFNPNRFLDDTTINPFHYIPFGQGPHICIGNRLAMVEIHTIAYVLLSKYKFEFSFTDMKIPELIPSAIISSKKKVRVKILKSDNQQSDFEPLKSA